MDDLEKEGVVRQLGFHTQVHTYLAAADAIVVASFHEGMSNALIEGAATGRPVIASDISGCREAFEEGVTGFGFTPGKPAELIDAMDKFLSLSRQERAAMGRRGREKMEREFDGGLYGRGVAESAFLIKHTEKTPDGAERENRQRWIYMKNW